MGEKIDLKTRKITLSGLILVLEANQYGRKTD